MANQFIFAIIEEHVSKRDGKVYQSRMNFRKLADAERHLKTNFENGVGKDVIEEMSGRKVESVEMSKTPHGYLRVQYWLDDKGEERLLYHEIRRELIH